MVVREVDDLAVGEDALHLRGQVVELDRAVEVVEHRRAAAQQELAQVRHVGVGHLQVAGLDEVNPGMLEEARVVERQDHRIFNLDRRRGLHATRQVLLGRGGVDVPRLAVEVLRLVGAFGVVVVLDPNEAPLQPGEPLVAGPGQLGIGGRLKAPGSDTQASRPRRQAVRRTPTHVERPNVAPP